MTEYYERVARSGSRVERFGVFRRAVPGSPIADEVFNVPSQMWQYTSKLSLGLRHLSDDDFSPITLEQARARLAILVPASDPDEILGRPARTPEG